jgi:hypothetical protein
MATKLEKVEGLEQFVVEAKNEGIPWESAKPGSDTVLARVIEAFPQTGLTEKSSIIPLRNLYREALAKAKDERIVLINTKARGWKERIIKARKAGDGIDLLVAKTGLKRSEVVNVLKEADPRLVDGRHRWVEGEDDPITTWSRPARLASETTEVTEDEPTEPVENEEPVEEPEPVAEAPKPKRRRRRQAAA